MKKSVQLTAKEILLPILAAALYSLNIKTFVAAGELVPGGFSGLALLLTRIADKYTKFHLNYSALYFLFNIPGAVVVYKSVSKRFCMISFIDIIMTTILTAVLPEIPVTDDILLICVFGGILSGASEVLMLLAGGCGGGTSFWSIYLAKKKGKSMWYEMLVFNIGLLLVSGLLFNWEIALYSIIFQFVSTEVINMFDNRFKRACFVIVTDKPEEIIEAIKLRQHHSVTEFKGIGSFTREEKTVLYTVVGKYEEKQLIDIIADIDPNAFINVINSERIVGNFNQLPY